MKYSFWTFIWETFELLHKFTGKRWQTPIEWIWPEFGPWLFSKMLISDVKSNIKIKVVTIDEGKKIIEGMNMNKVEREESGLCLDSLYSRLHQREIRNASFHKMVAEGISVPEMVINKDDELLATVRKNIDDRHAKLKKEAEVIYDESSIQN